MPIESRNGDAIVCDSLYYPNQKKPSSSSVVLSAVGTIATHNELINGKRTKEKNGVNRMRGFSCCRIQQKAWHTQS